MANFLPAWQLSALEGGVARIFKVGFLNCRGWWLKEVDVRGL